MNSENMNNENLVTDATPSPPQDEEIKTNSKSNVQTEKRAERTHRNTNKRQNKPGMTAVTNIMVKDSQGVQIGSTYTIIMGKTNKDKANKSRVAMTKDISNLLQRLEPVTKEVISFVSDHIGENWRIVCRSLGYSDGQIFQYNELHNIYGIREVVYNILLDWIQNKPELAKLGTLATALWNAPERDVVQRMSVELSLK